ncbi:hypothetical protein AWH60_11000 [Pseudoalteromonas haloplanktis]|nr:hypothetical protein AWH60_11000 [Pseudoalteromonas haloplanktis]
MLLWFLNLTISRKIQALYFAGLISKQLSQPVKNLDQCSPTFRVFIPHDLPGKDVLVSAAMMTFSSGKKVGFHGSGFSTTVFWGGTVDVPIINNLWIF